MNDLKFSHILIKEHSVPQAKYHRYIYHIYYQAGKTFLYILGAPPISSAFKSECNCHFSAQGRNCMSHCQALQDAPNIGKVLLHKSNKIKLL
jgi:hypothetical protein